MNQTTMTAVGTLITPVQLRHTPDGTPVTSFRIACNERRLDRESGLWVDRDTLYTSVTCWRRLAENVCASFRSGDPIIVRGRIFTRSYDKDGRRNSVTEIEADVVGPDVSRCTASVSRARRAVPEPEVSVEDADGVVSTWSAAPDDTWGVAPERETATAESTTGGSPTGDLVAVAGH